MKLAKTFPCTHHFCFCSHLTYYSTIYLVAVLITGGKNLNTEELYLPLSGTSCSLAPLPDTRDYHTADNNILCGGHVTANTCLKWSPDTGSWEELLTLDVNRTKHVSWTPGPEVGIYLMGGLVSRKTTTLIKDDGTQEPAFQLKYETV